MAQCFDREYRLCDPHFERIKSVGAVEYQNSRASEDRYTVKAKTLEWLKAVKREVCSESSGS